MYSTNFSSSLLWGSSQDADSFLAQFGDMVTSVTAWETNKFPEVWHHFAIEVQGLLFCKIVSWKLSALHVDLSKLAP